MLAVLQIKNLGLVDSLTWEPGPGLTGVTGETGAGKSMIVGALKLVLGDRADRSLVRAGAAQCSVEALFEVSNPGEVNGVLADASTNINIATSGIEQAFAQSPYLRTNGAAGRVGR